MTQFSQSRAVGSSADWHRQQLKTFASTDAPLFSNEICLCCIRQRPQYRFKCGHSLCQTCVKVFHSTDPSDRWLIRVTSCLFCGTASPSVSIRMVPDTARARVLSIDGGGVRGSAPIKTLQAIQDKIGIPGHDIQRNFDLAFGTSSGAVSPQTRRRIALIDTRRFKRSEFGLAGLDGAKMLVFFPGVWEASFPSS